ncbi:MAG: BREX-1 system adenine-specific DNA-methyltransferase PglX [Oscillospiraceae bacterium]|nr:BREX-1 system adenine-specific DNA-methyltransferase PglX [Oscillospiraceae bacterium]
MNKPLLKKTAAAARRKLLEAARTRAASPRDADEAACLWFCRLIALRYMEANAFLPPDIAAGLGTPARAEALYQDILLGRCRFLAELLPPLFGPVPENIAALLPGGLCDEGGLVQELSRAMPKEEFTRGVELVGWLYQYYGSERREEAFEGLRRNEKLSGERVPAATQLFTPEWIVKYLAENSLGRILNGNGEPGWKYFVPAQDMQPEIITENIKEENIIENKIENIKIKIDITSVKIIDPCMGAGHMLVYAFELLCQAYRSQGYAEEEIPDLILRHNLFGLDIDERACRLAYFSLMMKARHYHGGFFQRDLADIPRPRVYSAQGDPELEEYGSLFVGGGDGGGENGFRRLLAQKYDCVITNPPYMGSGGMGPKLSAYLKTHYPDSKSDLCAAFIEACGALLKPGGCQAMITMHGWMFLSGCERLRRKILRRDIVTMAHLGARAFEEIGGEVVQTTAFVLRDSSLPGHRGLYARLVDEPGERAKEEAFLSGKNRYMAEKERFAQLPGTPIAYWAGAPVYRAFRLGQRMDTLAAPKQGLATGDNRRFLRLWHELKPESCGFGLSREEALASGRKWFPYNKGGGYRKWYGGGAYLVNWEDDGREIRSFTDSRGRARSRAQNTRYYFQECLSWCKISASGFSMRYIPPGYIFDVAGCSLFDLGDRLLYVLGFANSVVNAHLLAITSPTMNYEVGQIARLPVLGEPTPRVSQLAARNIALSRADWDAFEASWDFRASPLINGASSLREAYRVWERECEARFRELKANEEELNRFFIKMYGLEDVLRPDIEDRDISLRRADPGRDIRGLLSYAVGCLFGRYSLEGLPPEKSGILLLTDAACFENDIVTRFVEFVRAAYGAGSLEQNLAFIAEALYPGKSGSAREKIRRYFYQDFYKDHVKRYRRRPIYWMLDSGGEGGFRALSYLHRWNRRVLLTAREACLHPLMEIYEAASESEKLAECRRYDQIIASFAAREFELDLDEGVAAHYTRFQALLR